MEKLSNKKTWWLIILVIGIMSIIIVVGYNKKIKPYYSLLGEWKIGDNYIIPYIGFSSTYASADDLVGNKVYIYDNNNHLYINWQETSYSLVETEEVDEKYIFEHRMIKSETDRSQFSYPLKQLTFENEEAEILKNIFLFIDQKQDIYIFFSDVIGDLAIFPLLK